MRRLKVVVVLMFCFSVTIFAQKNKQEEIPQDSLIMQKVIEVPNISKDDLYVRANTWFVQSFKFAKTVIEFSDKENGKIVGKYTFDYYKGLGDPYTSIQTIIVEIKDERVRITIEEPLEKYSGSASMLVAFHGEYKPIKKWNSLEKIRENWRKTIASFEASLFKGTITNENW